MKYLRKINESKQFNEQFNNHIAWLLDDGFRVDINEDVSSKNIRIWKPFDNSKKGTYDYSSSANFLWSEVSDEIDRAFRTISEEFTFNINYIYTIEGSFTSNGYDRKFHTEEEFLNGLRLQSIKSFYISLNLLY